MTDAAGQVLIYTDGACRGNPGPSAAGWVIYDGAGALIENSGRFLGHRTNNEAEYEAACLGLEAALNRGARQVMLRADSQLMIRQLTGVYKVRHPRILPLYQRALRLLLRFDTVACEHVRRELNREADAAANLAIDQAGRS